MPARREDGNVLQKSSVTPSETVSPETRSGQSAKEMSQKPHSLALGTLLAGSGALSRSASADRFLMKVSFFRNYRPVKQEIFRNILPDFQGH